jgi:hypothetical protein
MAIKTFTTGEVLTAADTNTYLANSGLVLVTSATIGSGVTSVTVSNAFNSTYDNYRIIISGGVASASTSILVVLGASGTGYYSVLMYSPYGTSTPLSVSVSNIGYWPYNGSATTNNLSGVMDLYGPFLAKTTGMNASYMENSASGAAGTSTGFHNVATSYSSFQIVTNPITMTGGTITVYGYRKP